MNDLVTHLVRLPVAVMDPREVTQPWLRATVWVAVLILVGAVLGQLVVLPVLRWLVRLAGPVAGWLLRAVAVLAGIALLAPDAAVAAAFRARGGRPPALLYRYGDAVTALAGRVERGGRRLTGVLVDWLYRYRRPCLVVFVAVLGLAWNVASCAHPVRGGVCSPTLAGWVHLLY